MPSKPPRHDPLKAFAAAVPKQALRRPQEKTAVRGYGGAWQKASRAYLARHPLCVLCERKGFDEAAEVVDHIIPHRKDWALFWNRNNWQPLCRRCHNRKTVMEDGGRAVASCNG